MALAGKSYTLDTSAYSAYNRGDQRLRPYFTATTELLLPLPVVGELQAGFALGSRQRENELLLQRFIDQPNVRLVTLTDQTTQHFARVFAALRTAGTPIGTNDMWIAALTLEHGAQLLTLDSDFGRVPRLRMVHLGQ